MNFCFKIKPDKVSQLAAVVHEDGTVRVQTIDENNGLYYKLVDEFYKLTQIPALLNTSFNLAGEPIVETAKQALDDFEKSPMDYLVIGDYLVSKF